MNKNQFFDKYMEGYQIYDNKFSSDDARIHFKSKDVTSLFSLTFIDFLTNKDIYELLKSLHNLNSNSKYKIKSYYRKPKSYRKFKFIYPENFSGRQGLFAEVSVLKDDFIDKISISYSQRSNFMGAFQYDVSFKRPIKTLNEQHLFIKENIKYKNSDNTYAYLSNMSEEPLLSDTWMKTHSFYFNDVMQTKIIHSLFGKRKETHELMTIEYINGFSPLDRVVDKKNFTTHMAYVAFHKEHDVVLYISMITSEVPKVRVMGVSKFPIIRVLNLFAEYRNIFYYNLFLKYENNVLTSKVSKSNGILSNYKTFKWLIDMNNELTNSRDNISEEELNELKKDIEKDWEFIPTVMPPFIDIFNKERYDYLRRIYEENLNMFKTKVDVFNSTINLFFGALALILSIVAIIISIIV